MLMQLYFNSYHYNGTKEVKPVTVLSLVSNCDKYLLHIFVASLSCGIISMSILRFGGFEHMKIKTFLHQNIHYIILKSAMT